MQLQLQASGYIQYKASMWVYGKCKIKMADKIKESFVDSSIPCHPSIPQKHIPTLVIKVELEPECTVQQLLRCSWFGKTLILVKSKPYGSLEFPLQWLSQVVTSSRFQHFQGLGTHHFFKHIHSHNQTLHIWVSITGNSSM